MEENVVQIEVASRQKLPSVWELVPPKTLAENVRYRQDIRRWALQKKAHRDALWERCSKDFVFFCETFLWIFEPRPEPGRPQVIPFIPWEHQYPVINSIIANLGYKDIGLEKARGEGASWICLMIILWRFLFGNMESFGLVSRHELAVDNPDDPDSLGWKIDWQMKQLPLWMIGKRSTSNSPNDWSRNISKHTWVNNRNGCSITGYPATGDLGSGGRKTAFFMDELAKFPRGDDEEAMSATEPVTNCRLLVSTPDGAEGAYYRCMMEPSSMVKLILDWTRNPTRNKNKFRIDLPRRILISAENDSVEMPADIQKQFWEVDFPILSKRGFPVDDKTKVWSPWYVSRCVRPRMTPKKIAQEYDRDYGGSSSRFFPSVMIEMLLERCIHPQISGDFVINSETHTVQAFTRMKEGRFKMWADVKSGGKPQPGDYIVACDVATGQGGSMSSNSTISIVNRSIGKKIASYANPNIRPELLAELAVALCRWFRNESGGEAYMIWEGNGPGGNFRNHIMSETSFRNFYYRQQIKQAGSKDTKEPGWWSGKDSKRELLSKYRHALSEGHFENLEELALRETLCYVEDTGGKVKYVSGQSDDTDPANSGENHGDRVIADALANYAMVDLNGGEDIAKIAAKSNAAGPPEGSFAWRRKQFELAKKKKENAWW